MTNPTDILRANLPLYPICGRYKSDHQRHPQSLAITMAYLQLSSRAKLKGRSYYRLTCIALDLDGRHWYASDFRQLDIPVPDVLIHNPDKPSTHAVWILPYPVWMPIGAKPRPFGQDRQPWELYLAVEAWLVAATGADRSIRTLKVKNPWHEAHRTEWTHNGHVRGLDELVQWIPAVEPEPVAKQIEDDGRGRNVTLFRRALSIVSDLARKVGQGIDDLTAGLWDLAESLNDFPEPLPAGEVRSTLRSVARYAADWTIRSEPTRGWIPAKGLDPEEVRIRQSASASRTNEMRRDRTLAELTRVARLMIADGMALTKIGLARASGMARLTVRRAWDSLVTALLNTVPAIQGVAKGEGEDQGDGSTEGAHPACGDNAPTMTEACPVFASSVCPGPGLDAGSDAESGSPIPSDAHSEDAKKPRKLLTKGTFMPVECCDKCQRIKDVYAGKWWCAICEPPQRVSVETLDLVRALEHLVISQKIEDYERMEWWDTVACSTKFHHDGYFLYTFPPVEDLLAVDRALMKHFAIVGSVVFWVSLE